MLSSKSYAGRDTPAVDEAAGRSASVVYFETVGTTHDDGTRVRRVDREAIMLDLAVKQCAIAELIRTANVWLPIGPDDTVRQQEMALGREFRYYELTIFDSSREPMADHGADGSAPFEFALSNPADIAIVWVWVR